MHRRLLNPYQRNSVTITLRALETVMRETVASLSVQEQGILYQQKSTLSRQQQEQIEALRKEILNEINKLAKALALPLELRDTRSALQGQLAVLWSNLYDITAEKLAGYGEVSPDLSSVLDPHILHLIQLVQQMTEIVVRRENNQGNPD